MSETDPRADDPREADPAIVARNAVVLANQRLVRSIARRYRGRGVTLDDLVQAGNLGMIEAAGTFDETFACRFGTYATLVVRRYCSREVRSMSRPVRIPPGTLTRACREAAENAEAATGREAAAAFDRLEAADDGPATVDARDEAGHVAGMLAPLGETARACLTLTLGLGDGGGSEPLSTPEVARRLGMSRFQVRRANLRAIKELRERFAESA